jgi:tryptophan-rich sensory protein
MIPSWVAIGGITFLVALKWAVQLERPHWLTFEPLIPVNCPTNFRLGSCFTNPIYNLESNRHVYDLGNDSPQSYRTANSH